MGKKKKGVEEAIKPNPITRERTTLYLEDWVKNVYPSLNDEYDCIFGDSIIEHLNVIPNLFDKKHWCINACGGDTTGHLLWRFNNVPKDKVVNNAIVLIGINDIFKNRNLLVSLENIKEFIKNIKGEIVVIKVLNCNPTYENSSQYQIKIDDFNKSLESLENVKLVECEHIEIDEFNDQVHLNDNGYVKLINTLKKYM